MNKFDCTNWENTIKYVLMGHQFVHRNCTIDKAVGSKSIAITNRKTFNTKCDYFTPEEAIVFLNNNIEF